MRSHVYSRRSFVSCAPFIGALLALGCFFAGATSSDVASAETKVAAVSITSAPRASSSLGKLPPADRPIAEIVDRYIDEKLQAAKVKPAGQVDDANYIRRVTLDLVGRVPAPAEINDFVSSKASNKREQLVDRLLGSKEFVEHQVNEFDWMLMQGSGSLRSYLAEAFGEGRTWDKVFRELMLVDELPADKKPATDFLKGRMRDQDRLTNDVSSLFFGVNISCAQCHDHPLAKDWKQDHFYGLKSFLARSFDNGGFIGERDYGSVTFLTPKGVSKPAQLMFLTGLIVDEPKAAEPDAKAKKAEQDELKKLADKKQAPPKPKFSRRKAFADTALKADQRHLFSRAIVNRIWYRLLGQGLVMPIDQMHSGNPASHPELLEWLARDAAEHHFDFARLMRGIVLSQAYARSSRWDGAERPDAALFAVAQVRALTPNQYAASLRIATTDPESWKSLKTPADVMTRAAGLAGSSRGWASSFAPVTDNYQIGVTESLLLANSERMSADFLSDGSDRLVGRMKTLAEPEKQAEVAITTVFGRPAEDEERKLLAAYIVERKDRSLDAAKQVVWSLLTSSEFRFNY
jgi:hypothetical protein